MKMNIVLIKTNIKSATNFTISWVDSGQSNVEQIERESTAHQHYLPVYAD